MLTRPCVYFNDFPEKLVKYGYEKGRRWGTTIKAVLKQHKGEVVRKYHVRKIGIFGSSARGERKKRSDIDILVDFAGENVPSLLKLIEMESYLRRLLGKKVDWQIITFPVLPFPQPFWESLR